MTRLTPEWKRYVELLQQENALIKEEDAIKYIKGESGSWNTYKEAADSISEFLIQKTNAKEELSLSNIAPSFIHAIITISINTDDMENWSSDTWRDNLLYAKKRLMSKSRSSYPAPGGENDGGGNVWGSFRLKFNTGRGKKGEDLD